MRILIIALPRTGSNSLMEIYAKKYNLEICGEPYNADNVNKWKDEDLDKNNIVVKTLVNQVPKSEKNNITFWSNKSNGFDKTILLSRKDLKSCIESNAFLSYYMNKGFKQNEKYEWHYTPNYYNIQNFIIKCNNDLIEISKILNLEITYYEDIFDINSLDRYRIKNSKPNNLL